MSLKPAPDSSLDRRVVIKTGAKLAYAAPIVAATMSMTEAGVRAASGPCGSQDEAFSVQCTGEGQTCTPIHEISLVFAGGGASSVNFQAHPNHCSSISVQFFVDNVAVSGLIGPLAAGESTGPVSLGNLTGSHTIGIQATGVEGGCNTGALINWAGSWTFEIC